MSKPREEDANIEVGSKKAKVVLKALFSSVEATANDKDIPVSGNSYSYSYSCKAFLKLFHPAKGGDTISPGLTPKQLQSLVFETVGSMQKNNAKRFFSGLGSVLQIIISEEAYVPASAFADEGDEDEEKEIVPDGNSTECLHFMKYAAMCVSTYMRTRVDQAKQKRLSVGLQLQVLPEVYDVAAELHNILLSLHTCGPESIDAQNAVLSMCEVWWLANAANRDALIAQCLPLLLVQTLDGKDFLKSHMTKLFKLRDAFQVIDFTNPSSDSLRHLLLRVTSNPLCLRMPEGRKFLAFLFQDVDLIKDLHISIRAQIPSAKATVLHSYGEIYHRAWKNAADNPDIRDKIEYHALQDLMYAVIHASSPGTAKSIISVLEPLHDDKKTPGVAGLLYRSYGPILWRSLAAANPLVRKNAVVVLAKAFPVHDPSQSHMKEAVSKSTTALKKALQDKDPRVRVAGCEATAKICAIFWDALPASEIRMLLNRKSSPVEGLYSYAYTDILYSFQQTLSWNSLQMDHPRQSELQL
jgi:condensin-2 complex subunit G2